MPCGRAEHAATVACVLHDRVLNEDLDITAEQYCKRYNLDPVPPALAQLEGRDGVAVALPASASVGGVPGASASGFRYRVTGPPGAATGTGSASGSGCASAVHAPLAEAAPSSDFGATHAASASGPPPVAATVTHGLGGKPLA